MTTAAPVLDGRAMTENEVDVVRLMRAIKAGRKLDSREPDRGHGTMRVEVTDGWESLIKHEFSRKPAPRPR